MHPLRILSSAHNDVVSYAAHLQEISCDTAIRFLKSFDETLSLIQDWPELSPIQQVDGWKHEDLRIRSMRQFRNYLVFYRITGEEIEIFRVLHGSRDLDAAFGAKTT
jgi:plasmid stabilization system protein ParE